jgi:hypothetical protein
MPAKAGIQSLAKHWVPASAGTSGVDSYAASARAPFSAGVIAPEPLSSTTSFAE